MKRVNLILIACLACMLIFCIVFHSCGTLHAEVTGVAASASEHVDTYNSVIDILKSGTAAQLFTQEIPDSPDDIYLVATTVTLRNKGFCRANWVEVTVTGASGDIAVYSLSGINSDIPAGESLDLTLKFITRTPNETRKLKITYYIMGVQRTITVKI